MTKYTFGNYWNIFLGLLLLCYMLYYRLFKIRLPKELWILSSYNDSLEIRYNIIILVLIGLSISSVIVYKNLTLILQKRQKMNIFTSVGGIITHYLDHVLCEVYNFMAQYIPNGYYKISTFSYYFYETFSKRPETFFLFILYIIRSIILICFFIDIFIYFKLFYMYKALYLLIISLLIKLLLYIVRDFAKNLSVAESYLIITHKGFDKIDHLPITNYALRPEHQDTDLIYHVGQFILCNKVTGYLDNYDRYREVFSPYFNLILYSCYLFGWIYITIQNATLFHCLII